MRDGERDRLAERLRSFRDRSLRVDLGPDVGQQEPLRAGPRGPRDRPDAPRDGSRSGCRRAGTTPRRARDPRRSRTRRRSTPARCPRCRRAAGRRRTPPPRTSAADGPCARSEGPPHPTRALSPSSIAFQSKVSPQLATSVPRRCSAPAGAKTGRPSCSSRVAQQHVQPVDVHAVVRVLVGDDDRAAARAGSMWLLQHREGAVAAVHPDRGVAFAEEVPAARAHREVRRTNPSTPGRSAPLPRLDALDLRPEVAGTEVAERLDVTGGDEVVVDTGSGVTMSPSMRRASNAVSSALETSTTSRPITSPMVRASSG